MAQRLTVSPGYGHFTVVLETAQREGFFAAEGLDVDLQDRVPADETPQALFDRQGEGSFHSGQLDIYGACEWGAIKRVHDARVQGLAQPGRIVGRLPFLTQYTILVGPRSAVYQPADLAGKTIAIKAEAGSHYAAIESLEAVGVPTDEIKLVHIGGPLGRFQALLDGTVEAASLMEPYVSLAVKNGCRVVTVLEDTGSFMAADHIDAGTLERFFRAVNRAVAAINANPAAYSDQLLAEVPEEHKAEAGNVLQHVTFIEPVAYTPDRFERTYRWMVEHDMIPDGVDYDQLVSAEAAEVLAGLGGRAR